MACMGCLSLSTADQRKNENESHTWCWHTGSRYGYTKDDQDLSQSLAIGWCLGCDWWPDIMFESKIRSTPV